MFVSPKRVKRTNTKANQDSNPDDDCENGSLISKYHGVVSAAER